MSLQSFDLLELLSDSLTNLDFPTACKARDLILYRINELEQNLIEQRTAFRKEMLDKADALGIDIPDLFPEPVKVKVKAPPKYQDPTDPTRTWSGKGKAPNWLNAALESGKTLDDLLIPTTNIDPEVGF